MFGMRTFCLTLPALPYRGHSELLFAVSANFRCDSLNLGQGAGIATRAADAIHFKILCDGHVACHRVERAAAPLCRSLCVGPFTDAPHRAIGNE
jgi:hypothetical protein